MPQTFRVEALFPNVNAYEYFLERDGLQFRQLAMKALRLCKMDFLPGVVDGEDGIRTVRLATRPDFSRYVPQRWVDRLTGDQLEFVDEIQYNPQLLQGPTYTLVVKCVLPWMASRADINCRLSFEQQGSDCLQVLEGRVHIKLPAIGRIAEPLIVNGLRQAYADLPKLMAEWMQHRATQLSTGSPATLLDGRPDGLPGSLQGTIHAPAAQAETGAAVSRAQEGPAVPRGQGSGQLQEVTAPSHAAHGVSADAPPEDLPIAGHAAQAQPVQSHVPPQPQPTPAAQQPLQAPNGAVSPVSLAPQCGVAAGANCAKERGSHSKQHSLTPSCRADSIEHDALAPCVEQHALA